MNATAYAKQGWYVLPLKPQSKEPARFLRHGYLDATIDQSKIDDWFADTTLNIGLGIVQSNLVVLDFDTRNVNQPNEWNGLEKYCRELNTFTVETDDGWNYFYVLLFIKEECRYFKESRSLLRRGYSEFN